MKKSSILLIVFVLGVFLLNTLSVHACSAFMLKGDGYFTIGFNENWKTMPGMVVVNPRGVKKQSLNWHILTSASATNEKRISWESKYGSVSFNLLGLDMPCFGMNEKGLFIVELYLDKTFSKPDDRKASMFWAQWIQYQLDQYATVSELVKHLSQAPVIDWWPTFPGSHFFVCDKQGHTAALELIDGVFQVSRATTMPYPILCNEPYQQELVKLKKYQSFGGSEVFDMNSDEWADRFGKVAYYLKTFDNIRMSPLAYSWRILDNVKPGVWQLVSDVRKGELYFRTDVGKEIKSVALDQFDFSKSSTVLFLDINATLQGDVHESFKPLTVAINRSYVEKGFPVGYENDKFYHSLGYDNLRSNLDCYVKDIYGLKE